MFSSWFKCWYEFVLWAVKSFIFAIKLKLKLRSYVAYPGVGLALSTLVAYNASSGNGFNTLLISKFAIGVFNVPETYLSTRHHPSFRSYATDHTDPQYISKAWICWGEDSNPGPLQDHTEYASDLTLVATAPQYIYTVVYLFHESSTWFHSK